MIRKIADIRLALEHGAYYSALALALTLPDICGIVAYPEIRQVGERYIKWIDENVDWKDFKFGLDAFKNNEPSGVVCYALRCCYLHSGEDDITSTDVYNKKGCPIDVFKLAAPGEASNYGYIYSRSKHLDGTETVSTTIDVESLCKALCDATQKYYENLEDKSKFTEHECM